MTFSEKVQELKAVPITPQLVSLLKATWEEYRFPVIGFMVLRVVLSLVAAIVANSPFIAGEVTLYTYDRPALSSWQEAVLGTWQHWDGFWYLKIATSGYEIPDFSPAFYPLYPLLIRLVGEATQSSFLASGIAISNVAYFIVLIMLWKLLALDFSADVRKRAMLYIMLFPTSYYFFAVYTESLFLALAVSAFYFARKGNWMVAGLIGMFATLTRNTGMALALPFAIEYMRQRNFDLRKIGFDCLAIGLIPFGLAIYMGYQWMVLEDPFAFSAAQVHWGRSFGMPWQTLADAWARAQEPPEPFMTEPIDHPFGMILYWSDQISNHAYNFVFTIPGLVLAFASLKMLRPSYSLFAFAAVIMPLFIPSEDIPLFSMPRFLVILFPLFITLSLLVGTRVWLHRTILLAFITLLLVFSIRYFAWYWVA